MKKSVLWGVLLLSATSIAYADEALAGQKPSAPVSNQKKALHKKHASAAKRQRQPNTLAAANPQIVATAPAAPVDRLADLPAALPTFGRGFSDLPGHFLDPHDNTPMTFHGITLYGTIDIGAGYQTHSAPLSNTWSTGVNDVIGKQSNHTLFSVVPNNLSDSQVGIKVKEEITPGWSFVGLTQTTFDPQSFRIENARQALAVNDGVALAKTISAADSAKDGEPFLNIYGGISSPVYGTVTYGRQNSLGLDAIKIYDPMGASQTFSAIGYSGVAAGFGDTDTSRLSQSIEYKEVVGPAHFAVLYNFGRPGAEDNNSYQGDIGFDYLNFSFDAVGGVTHDAINASSLSGGPISGLGYFGNGLLNGTVSDNRAFMLLAKYTAGPLKFYGGFEDMIYSNPSNPMSVGAEIEGGYVLNAITTTSGGYNGKHVYLFWTGTKYAVTSNVDLAVAYYHFNQNNYTGSNGGGYKHCVGDVTSGACAGSENVISGLVDYRLTPHLDIYGGVMWSDVNGGMANGFLSAGAETAGKFQPVVGMRYQF